MIHSSLQALIEAGPEGLGLGDLVVAVQDAGAKYWDDNKAAKSSIASTCGHDTAFARIGQGKFALRALPGVAEVRTVILSFLFQKSLSSPFSRLSRVCLLWRRTWHVGLFAKPAGHV